MSARILKEWTVSKGDFKRSNETDYENNFKNAKSQKKDFEKKILMAFSISGLVLVLLVLELVTKV